MPSTKKSLADLKTVYKEIQAKKNKQVSALATASAERVPGQSETDRKLFGHATRHATPLKTNERVVHHAGSRALAGATEQRRQQALGLRRDLPAASPLRLSDGPEPQTQSNETSLTDISFAAPGVGVDILRKLKQAYWPIGAQLDLHGLNADQAREQLVRFIQTSQTFGTRCIKVVHGKGYGSKQGHPVLKQLVAHWLKQISAVQAFATPSNSHGGNGVLFVLIQRL